MPENSLLLDPIRLPVIWPAPVQQRAQTCREREGLRRAQWGRGKVLALLHLPERLRPGGDEEDSQEIHGRAVFADWVSMQRIKGFEFN